MDNYRSLGKAELWGGLILGDFETTLSIPKSESVPPSRRGSTVGIHKSASDNDTIRTAHHCPQKTHKQLLSITMTEEPAPGPITSFPADGLRNAWRHVVGHNNEGKAFFQETDHGDHHSLMVNGGAIQNIIYSFQAPKGRVELNEDQDVKFAKDNCVRDLPSTCDEEESTDCDDLAATNCPTRMCGTDDRLQSRC